MFSNNITTRAATDEQRTAPAGAFKRVGVTPATALRPYRRLLACLSDVFPVRFEGCAEGELDGLDALLAIGCRPRPLPDGIPTLLLAERSQIESVARRVQFTRDLVLPTPLRGRSLLERAAPGAAPVGCERGDAVLASSDGAAAWWMRPTVPGRCAGARVSAFGLPQLEPGQTLRAQLEPGRFMGLVPLLELLRDVCGELGWTEPALRAAFVIDDPNLHCSSYGFLRYRELVAHARAHGYHAALATVPLDGWLFSRRAAALVREHAASLSLLVHGNDHVARELGRLTDDRDADAAVAQALGRIERLERRARVQVARVMAPPHGACSETALRALFRAGFEAACISRPYPWLDRPPAGSPLAGWYPAEIVAGGIPVLPRYPLAAGREELTFRALLGQPLILFGHHTDLAPGLEVLARAAADVTSLGKVHWGAPDSIARASFAARRRGERLEVRLHARRALVSVPPGAKLLRVNIPQAHGELLWDGLQSDSRRIALDARPGGLFSEWISVHAGERIELTLGGARARSPAGSSLRPRPWPLARRVLVEGRDRLRPVLGHAPRSRAAASR